jgi:adenine-specific DNA-methyltransferase
MPTLHWIWKDKVVNHHLEVPYRILQKQYIFGDVEKSENKIIHGDNLDALKSLLPEYEGKVKCIYIDPPYNTGNEWWAYNDNVSDPKLKKWLHQVVWKEWEDLTRHDKWLCMMYPRLKLLHKLLQNDGVIFISIDDNEFSSLKMLMDEIFGINSLLSVMVWRSEWHTDNQFEIKHIHEYILTYVKNKDCKKSAIWNVVDPNTREESNLWKWFAENSITKNWPKNPPSEIILPVWFPVSTKDKVHIGAHQIKDGMFEEIKALGYISKEIRDKFNLNNTLPIKLDDIVSSEWVLQKPVRMFTWWANANKLKQFIESWFNSIKEEDWEITFYLSKGWVIYYKKQRGEAKNIVSVLQNFWTTEQMSSDLKKMGIKFSYPKPVDLLSYLLKVWNVQDWDIVVDSFAWSGSTAHAILNLNKQDWANRKFILIETEEYAETITAERIKKVINGYWEFEWTGGDFEFLTLWSPLMTEDGLLSWDASLEDIRSYICYTETGSHLLDIPLVDTPYWLARSEDRDYYFYFERESITVLDREFLSTIVESQPYYTIWADQCHLSASFMKKEGITFRKIPRDIRDI